MNGLRHLTPGEQSSPRSFSAGTTCSRRETVAIEIAHTADQRTPDRELSCSRQARSARRGVESFVKTLDETRLHRHQVATLLQANERFEAESSRLLAEGKLTERLPSAKQAFRCSIC